MFIHMVLVKKDTHTARGTNYEILVYQVEETEEYNIYVAKGGFGVGNVFTASQEMVRAIASDSGGDVVEELN